MPCHDLLSELTRSCLGAEETLNVTISPSTRGFGATAVLSLLIRYFIISRCLTELSVSHHYSPEDPELCGFVVVSA